ncbi:c-type cytochrome [Chitinophaga qingshengii]|uniref:C-type cytochrome n=1 Tax=Chitinophaga qingshengii TaxID=1569794 RepID=A0ABR7TX81_9BACT|nr:c-type cytochrome [Chitinophaga qingshengii]MBC9934001.1 c-type cytochrome [Chitinophaga qingshengii]
MFPKMLKWAGIAILGLISLLLIVFGVFYYVYSTHVNKSYAVEVRSIPVPGDSATIAAGAHLYAIKGCGDCHGADLGGKVFLDDPAVGFFAGANLTGGQGGRPTGYTDTDWLRAMRHGLRTDNKTLLLMPSYEYAKLSDHDIAALVAFCKAQPAVDRTLPPMKTGPVGKVLAVLGKVPLFPAEKIDHGYQQPDKMPVTVTKEYGEYLSVSCTGCHNPRFTGGESPIPGGKRVSNITAAGNLGKWTAGEFITALRTGKTPEGLQLKNKDMPWSMTAQYTDEELQALFLYLKSL